MLKHRLSQVKTCRTLGGSPERTGRQMSAEAALRALAEPRRQQILRLVRATPRSVGEGSPGGFGAHLPPGPLGRPEGLESLDQFLAELWPAGLRRLKAAVESDTVETVEA